jgi:hypothetical protein
MMMARNYVQRCQEVEREPDAKLLGPIAETLQRLQEGRGPEGKTGDQP